MQFVIKTANYRAIIEQIIEHLNYRAVTGWPPICQNEIPGVDNFFPGFQKILETMHIEE